MTMIAAAPDKGCEDTPKTGENPKTTGQKGYNSKDVGPRAKKCQN